MGDRWRRGLEREEEEEVEVWLTSSFMDQMHLKRKILLLDPMLRRGMEVELPQIKRGIPQCRRAIHGD